MPDRLAAMFGGQRIDFMRGEIPVGRGEIEIEIEAGSHGRLLSYWA